MYDISYFSLLYSYNQVLILQKTRSTSSKVTLLPILLYDKKLLKAVLNNTDIQNT